MLNLASDFYLPVVFQCVLTNNDVESLWKIKTGECDMNSIPYHSNNSAMPVWVTIDEVVNVQKSKRVLRLRPVKSGAMRSMGILLCPIIFSLL